MPPHSTEAVWRKSSRSNGDGNVCVEVAFLEKGATMRDSKNPNGGALVLPPEAWKFLRGALSGP